MTHAQHPSVAYVHVLVGWFTHDSCDRNKLRMEVRLQPMPLSGTVTCVLLLACLQNVAMCGAAPCAYLACRLQGRSAPPGPLVSCCPRCSLRCAFPS